MRRLWSRIGILVFYCTWPLIYLYSLIGSPRTRVIIIADNHVLLVKNWLGDGSWALAGGGKHKGESAQAAAIREVAEELSITLQGTSLIDLGRYTSRQKGGLISKYYLFAAELPERPLITLQKHEIMDFAWLPLTSLDSVGQSVSSTVTDSVDTWRTYKNLVS